VATRLVFQLSGKQSDGVRLFARWLRHHSRLFTSCQTALHARSRENAARLLSYINMCRMLSAVESRAHCTDRPTDRRLLKLRQVSSNNSEKTVEKEKSEWAHIRRRGGEARCPRLQARQAREFVTFNELSLSLSCSVPYRNTPLVSRTPGLRLLLAGWGWVHNVQSHYHLEHPRRCWLHTCAFILPQSLAVSWFANS
jgi:hypothetical protein